MLLVGSIYHISIISICHSIYLFIFKSGLFLLDFVYLMVKAFLNLFGWCGKPIVTYMCQQVTDRQFFQSLSVEAGLPRRGRHSTASQTCALGNYTIAFWCQEAPSNFVLLSHQGQSSPADTLSLQGRPFQRRGHLQRALGKLLLGLCLPVPQEHAAGRVPFCLRLAMLLTFTYGHSKEKPSLF